MDKSRNYIRKVQFIPSLKL